MKRSNYERIRNILIAANIVCIAIIIALDIVITFAQ